MLRKLTKFALKNPRVHAALKKVYVSCVADLPSAAEVSGVVGEISPIGVRVSNIKEQRLNLLIPGLSVKHVFGGIATALHLFDLLISDGVDARIIITDEFDYAHDNNKDYKSWRIRSLEDDDCAGKVIVCAGDRYGKAICLRENDFFVATAWWTSFIANQFLVEQSRIFNKEDSGRFAYLIQDFEPGFYPWSSRYALAESTYHNNNVVAVFNTSILKSYFDLSGYSFGDSFVFEPVLNEKLRPFLGGAGSSKREKIVLIYGRPGVSRNAFEVVVMALKAAIQHFDFAGWKFYSAGESHPDVDLGGGFSLSSLGKLSIEEYGALLKRVYIGVSLMVSPHPSYPPLEMASFGIKVITNRYSNKNLSDLSSNIYSVDYLSPLCIAELLGGLALSFEEPDHASEVTANVFFDHFVNCVNPFSDIVSEVRAALVNHV